MADKPTREFGKRRPPPEAPIPSPPAKRSAQVVLLVMGTLAVGAGAAALMPRDNCPQAQPGMATPAECQSRGSSSGGSGGSGGSSRYGYYSGGSSSSSSSGTTSSDSGSSHVSRGGFGSFAHAFGFSGG